MIKIIICSEGFHDTGRKQAVCHIVCAGEDSGSLRKPLPGEFVIAADGGLLYLEKAGVTPDLTIGDFDSLGYLPANGEVIKLNAAKDDTDTLAAVRIGLERGYRLFCLHCGMGGRLDHTLANIQTLAFVLEAGGMGMLFGKNEAAVLVKDAVSFPPGMRGYVSVFAYSGEASGVTLEGLKYQLKNAVLRNVFPIGVSNEFIGTESHISVKNGTLMIIFERKIMV